MAADRALDRLELVGLGRGLDRGHQQLLADSPLFRDLEWSDIEMLSKYMGAFKAYKGRALFKEGESADFMVVILDGKVEIFKDDRRDEQKAVTIVSSGRTLGEMAVVDGERRSATCVAREDTLVAVLTNADFEKMLSQNPSLGIKVLLRISKLLSQRLRMTSGMLVDLLGQT